MESLTIDYELPLKTNKSLTPSSLHPRPNSKSKPFLKLRFNLKKLDENKTLKNILLKIKMLTYKSY